MSQWWSLTEKKEVNPLSYHQTLVDTKLDEYFPTLVKKTVGNWAKLRQFIAFISQQLEASSVQSYNDLQNYILAHSFPNKNWWIAKMLEFQMGDTLQVDANYNLYYPVIDPTKRIIKHVSIREQPTSSYQRVILKYAKEDYSAFTSQEITAINAYITDIWIVGLTVTPSPALADQFKCTIQVEQFSQSTTTGTIALNTGIGTQFATAAQEFLTALPLDGIFTLSALEIHLQEYFDNRYIRVLTAQAKGQGQTAVWTPVTATALSDGGIFTLDAANSSVTII